MLQQSIFVTKLLLQGTTYAADNKIFAIQRKMVFILLATTLHSGLPWQLSGKESTYQCKRCGFDHWARKAPWRRKWQPIPGFLPEKSHEQRSLVCYSPKHHKESDRHDWATKPIIFINLWWQSNLVGLFLETSLKYVLTIIKQREVGNLFIVHWIKNDKVGNEAVMNG